MEQRNIATGNATVGAQIGHVEGSFTLSQSVSGSAPDASIIKQLNKISEQISAALTRGEIDRAMASAAQSSVEAASEAASDTRAQPSARSERLGRALATLKAAVVGVAGLSDAVANLIKSVSGFS